MAYRVKYGINTAVTIETEIGKDEEGNALGGTVTLLPGATLPANTAKHVLDGLKKGNEHLNSLIEEVDGDPAPAVALVEGDYPVADYPGVDIQQNPFMTAQAVGITGDYESNSAADLKAEVERRGLEVEGTGANGNVVKADLVAALEDDDENS